MDSRRFTVQLSTAGHEVAAMERLFPSLPGMRQYKTRPRQITKRSNNLLLDVVEDLTYVYSDGREIDCESEQIEAKRKQVLEDLITRRDEFVVKTRTYCWRHFVWTICQR